MTTKNIIRTLVGCLLCCSLTAVLSACSDNTTAGTPEITSVRILSDDDEEYAVERTTATPGTTLVVMGRNLSGATQLLINGQDVGFNSTFNTDNSIIATVPTEEKGFKLSAFYDDIPDEIRVTTSGGVAVYSFKITAPYPQLTRMQATYPRETGDTIELYGMNLVDIKSIYVTNITAARLDSTEWSEIPGTRVEMKKVFDIMQDHRLNTKTNAFETESVVGAVLPEALPDSGAVVVETAAATVYLPFSVLPGKPAIYGISSDMPQIGEELVITGRDFVSVSSVNFGDVTWNASELKVSESQDTIYMTFKNRPAVIGNAKLSVTTIGGTSAAEHFYDLSTLVTDFDGRGKEDGYSGGASYPDSGTNDGKYAYFFNENQPAGTGWGPLMAWQLNRPFTMPDYVPASATADELYIAYEVYDAGDFNLDDYKGYLRIATTTVNSDGWDSYHDGNLDDGVPVNADINGQFHKNKWYRAVIPLSSFNNYRGLTLTQIQEKGLFMILFQANSFGSKSGRLDMKMDNLRVIYIAK
ncbi:MAG: glycan-binding surface protein [Prevotella sp.]